MARKLLRVWVAFSGTVTQTEVSIPEGTARDRAGERGVVGLAGGTDDAELCLSNL